MSGGFAFSEPAGRRQSRVRVRFVAGCASAWCEIGDGGASSHDQRGIVLACNSKTCIHRPAV